MWLGSGFGCGMEGTHPIFCKIIFPYFIVISLLSIISIMATVDNDNPNNVRTSNVLFLVTVFFVIIFILINIFFS